jgi:hypothetical protein
MTTLLFFTASLYLDRDYELSKSFFLKALNQTHSVAERKLIERHILEVESELKKNGVK